MTTIIDELTVLAAAIESRDADAVTAHYASDAILTVPGRRAPAVHAGRLPRQVRDRGLLPRGLRPQHLP